MFLQFGSRKYATFFSALPTFSFRMGRMNKVNQIDESFSYLSDDNKVRLLLYGDSRFDDNKNNFILSILFFMFPFLVTKNQ